MLLEGTMYLFLPECRLRYKGETVSTTSPFWILHVSHLFSLEPGELLMWFETQGRPLPDSWCRGWSPTASKTRTGSFLIASMFIFTVSDLWIRKQVIKKSWNKTENHGQARSGTDSSDTIDGLTTNCLPLSFLFFSLRLLVSHPLWCRSSSFVFCNSHSALA